MTAGTGRRVLVQYLALALVWGASFLFIKVGLEGLSPAQVVLGRVAAGATALGLVALVRRRPLPRDRGVWGHLLVVALLLCVVPFLPEGREGFSIDYPDDFEQAERLAAADPSLLPRVEVTA